jgi:fucose 4-O-acetylase-like acetyltransferase
MIRFNFAFAIVALAAVSFGSDLAGAKKILQRKSAEFVVAFKSKDAAWFEKACTDDYTETENKHTSTKKEAIAQMKSMMSMCKSIDAITEKQSGFKMQGKNVLVISTTHFVGTFASPNGKASKIVDDAVAQEVWVPVGSDYKLKSSVTLKDKMLVDGKPAKPGM